MGRYFNPATIDSISAQGGRILNTHSRATHASLIVMLEPGEALAVALSRPFVQIADVTDPGEFAKFQLVVAEGHAYWVSYYAIPSDAKGWETRFGVMAPAESEVA